MKDCLDIDGDVEVVDDYQDVEKKLALTGLGRKALARVKGIKKPKKPTRRRVMGLGAGGFAVGAVARRRRKRKKLELMSSGDGIYEIKKFKPLLAAGIAGATAAGVAGEKLAARRRRRGTKAAIKHLKRKGWRLAWVRPRVKRTK